MAKRSPWARQYGVVAGEGKISKRGVSRKQFVREARENFAALSLSPKFVTLCQFRNKMRDNEVVVSFKEASRFMEEFPAALVEELHKAGQQVGIDELAGVSKNKAPELLRRLPELLHKRGKFSNKLFYRLTANVLKRAWQERVVYERQVLAEQLVPFLVARKIPVVPRGGDVLTKKDYSQALLRAVDYFLEESVAKNSATRRFDLAVFEGRYLKELAVTRQSELGLNSIVNDIMKRAFLGRFVPSEVRRPIKEGIKEQFDILAKKNFEEYKNWVDARIAQKKPPTMQERIDYFQNQRTRMIDSLVNTLRESVALQLPAKRIGKASKHEDEKSGAQSEKRALLKRKSEIESRRAAARAIGVPFDIVADSLSHIGRRNSAAAASFWRLLEGITLSRSNFLALHSKGPLAERVFTEVINNPKFLHNEAFGIARANDLATMLIFIGAGGTDIVKARNALVPAGKKKGGSPADPQRTALSHKLFDFLVSHGYVNTRHHGGSSANLSRFFGKH